MTQSLEEVLKDLPCLQSGHVWQEYKAKPRWFKYQCARCGEVCDTKPEDRKYT